ncbi:hypothetical protein Tco_0870405 [Tanacetum coccineum]
MLNLRVGSLVGRKDLVVVNLVWRVMSASAQCMKTCSVVSFSSQRSRFGYGDNTNKFLREPQEGEMGLDDQKWVVVAFVVVDLEWVIDEKLYKELIEDDDVPLVDGVLEGALGAFGDGGCCLGDGVLALSHPQIGFRPI